MTKRIKGVWQGDKFESYNIGTCKNCLRDNVKIRRVRAISWLSKANRGWYNICFDCVGPKVFWKKGGRTIESPTNYIETPDGLVEYQSSASNMRNQDE